VPGLCAPVAAASFFFNEHALVAINANARTVNFMDLISINKTPLALSFAAFICRFIRHFN
jgi:hypothetical protein